MEKIRNIVSIIAVVLMCTACNGILDKGPLDKYSEKDIWSSVELTQAFIYPTLNDATGKMVWKDQWTDNNVIQEDGDAENVNKEQIDRYYDAGWNIYGSIRNCNLVLEQMKTSDFLEKDKNHFIAQAKMLRAMLYFVRARMFGKLMIVDRLIDPAESMCFSRTKTIKETYDFILKDLQEAVPYLPVTLNNKQGMLTQGAAYALLAEAALHGAAYIESEQEAYYEIAREASEKLFALGVYELDSNYEKLFNDFDYAMGSKEIILAQWKHENNTKFSDVWMQALVPNINNDKMNADANPKLADSFEGWPTMFPSVDLVNAYQVIDEDGTAKDWNQTTYYNHYKEKGGYVSKAIYKNRDQRFYATIVYDSTHYFNSIVTTRELGNLHWGSNIYGDWGMTKTGYVYRKGMYEVKPVYNSEPTFYHYVVLRLGRSYLNYAEVMLRQNKVEKAVEYINKTRTTHGKLPALSLSLSLSDAWREYKRERRIDLVMEGDRYWSLLRWGKADKKKTIDELNVVHQAISISKDGKSFEFIPLPFKGSINERIFTEKRYLFPVPQDERNQNTALDQNMGW